MGESDSNTVESPPGRSFLTDSNRDFLASGQNEEQSKSTVRQHRYQVRRNFQSALIDYQYLWNLDDKDLINAIKPLVGVLEINVNSKGAIKNELNPSELSDEEEQIGESMHVGVIDLIAILTYLTGPETVGEMVEEGINRVSKVNKIRTNSDTGLYDIELLKRK